VSTSQQDPSVPRKGVGSVLPKKIEKRKHEKRRNEKMKKREKREKKGKWKKEKDKKSVRDDKRKMKRVRVS
jgi:hypothetical protein